MVTLATFPSFPWRHPLYSTINTPASCVIFWGEHRNSSQSLEIWRETKVRSWHTESRSPRTPRRKRILRTTYAWMSLENLLVHLHSWVESFYRDGGSGLGHRAVSQSGRRYWLMMVFSMGRGVRHGNTTIIYHTLFQRGISFQGGKRWEALRCQEVGVHYWEDIWRRRGSISLEGHLLPSWQNVAI